MKEQNKSKKYQNDIKKNNHKVPILPLRDIVIYPNMIIPLFVGRKKSILCLELAMKQNKKIMLIAQKKSSIENPQIKDLFNIGTISYILQILKLPDGTVKVLIEGLFRAKLIKIKEKNKCFIATFKKIKTKKKKNKKRKILVKTIINQFEIYIELNKKIPKEVLNSLNNIKDSIKLADTIASHIPLKLLDKQKILELKDINKRLEYLMVKIESEIDILKIEKKIRNRVKEQIEKSQREYYLNEQMKAIKKELNYIDDISTEYNLIKKKILKLKLSKEAKEKTESELQKLKMMSPMSAEANISRTYIEWIIQIPWYKKNRIKKNLNKAKEILDIDHFGLNHVKERILEYLAVQNRSNKIKGPILCFIGPPGVGKTSLGKSISKATGRKYTKISLGGIKDEAEIRGHRKTYIGAMPGKIIQQIIKTKVKNPLFLLDEIDKMSNDLRGDPASALLEVLDPEQNNVFNDHYIEINYDLSNIMFIATANSINNIPFPLLDRMEVIKIVGYTEEEKKNIAIKYLVPKQIKNNALKNNEIKIKKESIIEIIRYYTKESGVRELERQISKICRKSVKQITLNLNKNKLIVINKKNVKKYLGIKKFDYGKANKINKIGQVTGLAWTEVGGELLIIESRCIDGKGKLTYTGSLGKVMQESIQASLTVVRSLTKKLKIKKNFYIKKDIHVHIPEGATPKDGPSAGIAVCTSIISTLTKNPIKSYIAMTGEITLNGDILPIGGLKEKLLAALRGGIKKVIIPYNNKKDLQEMPKNIIKDLKIYYANNIKKVLNISLTKNPF